MNPKEEFMRDLQARDNDKFRAEIACATLTKAKDELTRLATLEQRIIDAVKANRICAIDTESGRAYLIPPEFEHLVPQEVKINFKILDLLTTN